MLSASFSLNFYATRLRFIIFSLYFSISIWCVLHAAVFKISFLSPKVRLRSRWFAGLVVTGCRSVCLLNICISVSKHFAIELHVLLYPNITHCHHQKYAQYHQRGTAVVINIRCCLSNFQVARLHAVCCIKENIHLKVDFFFFGEHTGGWNTGVFVGSEAFRRRCCSLGGTDG